MNRRRLIRLLPDPAAVRRWLGLAGQAGGEEEAGTDRPAGVGWRLRRWLGRALHEPRLWHPTRRSVAGGVAVGLFVSWLPVPLQMLLAAALASVVRVHVPVSVVMVWFTNPLTIGPLLYAAWLTGSTLLGETPGLTPAPAAASPASVPATAPDGTSLALASEAMTALTPGGDDPGGDRLLALLAGLGEAWPALLLGCLFLAACSAVAGFVLVRLLWRLLALRRWRLRRRAGRRSRP